MTTSPDSIWSDPALVDQLVQLWEDGVTTAEIGHRLSTPELTVTKNAVIGKVRRLGLPERTPRVEKPTPRTPATALEESKPGTCMWPHGHPGDPEFRFCGSSPLVTGKPYCSQHAARAYERPKPYQPRIKDVA